MLNVLKRIVLSKKSVLATVLIVVDLLAVWGFDIPKEEVTQGVLGVFNGLGALLIAAQAVIDAVHGSPSDANGTGS